MTTRGRAYVRSVAVGVPAGFSQPDFICRRELHLSVIRWCGVVWPGDAVRPQSLDPYGVWFVQGIFRARFMRRESHMHGVLNEVYCKKISEMGVIFRDESNDGN